MCSHSNDGKDGARNHVSCLMFKDNKTDTAKKTRSARTGQITVPPRGGDTFITPAAACGHRVEQVGHATQSNQEDGSKEGGIRFGKSLITLVETLSLQDFTSRLRLVGYSLRVMGRLLWDLGRLP
jgi:hypothetical protein